MRQLLLKAMAEIEKVKGNTGFSVGSVVKKNLLPMQETCVRPLGGEDPLEKEMGTHSSILAWEIPCTEEPTAHGVTKS